MNAVEVERVAGMLHLPLSEPDLGAWVRALASFDYQHAFEAADDWSFTMTAPPSLNEFVDAVQARARVRASERQALADDDSMGRSESRSRGARIARIIGEVISEREGGGLLGGDPDVDALAVHARISERLADAGIQLATAEPLYVCRCANAGVVAVGGRVRPCEGCNPLAFERWMHGHYAPDHSCAECEDLRRGRPRKAGTPSATGVE